MTEKRDTWSNIKEFYTKRFGISPELVDIMSVFDILKLCASGSSNIAISKFLGETEESIMEINDAYLGFMGWKMDLDFSPLKFYKELNNPMEKEFVDSVIQKYGYKLNADLHHMYESASIVERLEKLIDEKWI